MAEVIDALTWPKPRSAGGYAPETLRTALHFVAIADCFTEALEASLEFAGPANYCPVLVGSIAGARWGASSIPAEHLAHCADLDRVWKAVNGLRKVTDEPGVFELFAYLREAKIRTAIISSGPEQLARRAQRDLGIDEVRANSVITADGRITGDTEIVVPDAEKVRVGLEVMGVLGAAPARTAFVGDSDSDAGLADLVAVGIAYNTTSESLRAAADYILEKGDLLGIAAILDEILCLDEELPRAERCRDL